MRGRLRPGRVALVPEWRPDRALRPLAPALVGQAPLQADSRARVPARGLLAYDRAVGHADGHRGRWATVGAHWRPWAPCGARGRRRTGRGWWASHHRRGLPRPPRYGSFALQAAQWRAGASIARRAIVADAAAASAASALMHHPLAKTPQKGRNPAVRTQSPGAVSTDVRLHMGYPTPVGRHTLRRVARAAQHGGVGDVERRTASGERHDVIDRQVDGRVGETVVARAPVAVLTAPGAEHAGAQPLPGSRAVQGVVPAAVGLSRVLGAAAARAAGDDTADRAELHPPIVDGLGGGVYSLRVLRLQDQSDALREARVVRRVAAARRSRTLRRSTRG